MQFQNGCVCLCKWAPVRASVERDLIVWNINRTLCTREMMVDKKERVRMRSIGKSNQTYAYNIIHTMKYKMLLDKSRLG